MYEYNKVYQELADILNDKDVEKIYKNFRGMQVNFPIRRIINEIKDDLTKG